MIWEQSKGGHLYSPGMTKQVVAYNINHQPPATQSWDPFPGDLSTIHSSTHVILACWDYFCVTALTEVNNLDSSLAFGTDEAILERLQEPNRSQMTIDWSTLDYSWEE